MKNRKQISILAFTILLSFGCYERLIQNTNRVIDYRDLSVPEEGGIKFTKFTDDDEAVMGPVISNNKGVITWYAPSFIAISPDGKKIAYVGSSEGNTNIYIKSTEGGKQTIQRTFRTKVLDMAFSNDGKDLAFTERIDDDYNIYQINATQGSAVQQITATSNRETSPIYSPDDKSIFFTKSEYSSTLGTYRNFIWSIDRSTALLTQYSEGYTPTLNAADPTIVYITRDNKETGMGELGSINLVTGIETTILSIPKTGFSTPKISPDGKKILCVGSTKATSNRYENLDIYLVNVDGTGLTQLTFHPGHDVSAVWSPDGSFIYFLSQRGSEKGKYSVWQMEYKSN